jgi:hypothetical protein
MIIDDENPQKLEPFLADDAALRPREDLGQAKYRAGPHSPNSIDRAVGKINGEAGKA